MYAPEFYFGLMVGVVLAGFVGFVLGRIREEQKKIGSEKKPQKVMVETKKTPVQVVRESQAASVRVIAWLGLLAGVLWMAFQILF